jgi:hypothetical protein
MGKSLSTALCAVALGVFGVFFVHVGGAGGAGPLDPPAGPVAPTYRTLDQLTPAWDRVLPAAARFQIVMSGAGVLDLETGLVWERHCDSNFMTHNAAVTLGRNKEVGGRKGWRLPSSEELMTLIDMSQTPVRLPAGHPFMPPEQSGFQSFWTGTRLHTDGTRVLQVDLLTGLAADTTTLNQGQVWLVRGGSYSQPRP